MSAAVSLDEGEYTPPESNHEKYGETALVPQAEQAKPLRDSKGRLLPGQTANKFGSRPRRIREFEVMLNKEHRNIPRMQELFNRLRSLAMGEPVVVPFVSAEGEVMLKCELHADARFMQLYLDRLLGPAKAFDDSIDLSDAPDEVLQWLGRYIQQK